jgi:hypothetical protein
MMDPALAKEVADALATWEADFARLNPSQEAADEVRMIASTVERFMAALQRADRQALLLEEGSFSRQITDSYLSQPGSFKALSRALHRAVNR